MNIPCKVCNSQKTMVPQEVYRFSPVVVVIGYCFAIPSIIGTIIAFILTAFLTITAMASGSAGNVFASSAIGLIIFIIPALCAGIVGYILIGKKKILKCESCGCYLDRE